MGESVYDKFTYEELVKYDIWNAIRKKGKIDITSYIKNMYSDDKELREAEKENNPLLTDFDYVYEHCEEILVNDKFNYQNYQELEQYYTLFKVLTTKYPLEDDYLIDLKDGDSYSFKWSEYLTNFNDFFQYAFDERVDKFLQIDEVREFYKRYSFYFIERMYKYFMDGEETLLTYDFIINYYINNPRELIILLSKPQYSIHFDLDILLNDNLVNYVSHTYDIEAFYSNIELLSNYISPVYYIDKHIKYLDSIVEGIKDGILPIYDEVKDDEQLFFSNYLDRKISKRILDINGEMSNDSLLKEMSKYMVYMMYMSRYFQTSPYNLLIDIRTLYEFSIENNIELKGIEIYRLLLDYKSLTTNELIELYNKSKDIPIKEVLYDDWQCARLVFINELNDRIYLPKDEDKTFIDGIECYDISNIDCPILVHNTTRNIKSKSEINKMLNKIEDGIQNFLCLSLQDNRHKVFFSEGVSLGIKTIKLAYGRVDANRVGIIYHKDAYSITPNEVENGNISYKRELYTVDSFMNRTIGYNEIVYVIEGVPFIPIGVICENEITNEEVLVARKLGVPVLFRRVEEEKLNYEKESNEKVYYRGSDVPLCL